MNSSRRKYRVQATHIALLPFVLLLCCALPSIASKDKAGRDLYVSNERGKDGNDGSLRKPWASIQHAAEQVKPGDTVHVEPGEYKLPLIDGTWGVKTTHNGSDGARITFISDKRWGARLVSQAADGSAAWLNRGNYVDIVGFDVTGSATSGIRNDASFVRIIGNHVHNIPTACNSDGGAGIVNTYQFGGKQNDVLDNVVDHIGPYPGCSMQHGSGIYAQGAGGRIVNNIVHNNGKNGIQLWHAATNQVITHNLTFNNIRSGIVVGDGDSGAKVADNCVVTNNISVSNGHWGIQETGTTGVSNVYENNLVYGNRGGDIRLQNGLKAVGTITADPAKVFVRWQADGNGDYHPAENGPAYRASTDKGDAPTDHEGRRPEAGSKRDIGPLQHKSGEHKLAGTQR